MRSWLLALVAALVSLLVTESRALACVNATMSETEAVRKLKEAEVALEQGDVLTARDLAHDVRWTSRLDENLTDPLAIRAARIEALAYVRDRDASDGELARATEILRARVEQTGRSAPPDLLADYGEALERSGHAGEAYDVLRPLADKDLIGSAYAYAALARASRSKADAEQAMKRCEAMAVSPAACRGEYPRRPLLRGRPLDFAALAAPFLGLGLRRLRRKRLWSAFRAPVFAALVGLVAAGTFGLANLRLGPLGFALAVPALLFLDLAQRRRWVDAIRRGKIEGFVLRPATPDDVAPATLLLLGGRGLPEVIEETAAEGYRTPARGPIRFRVERKKVPVTTLVLVGVAVALSAGCALVFMTLTRGG